VDEEPAIPEPPTGRPMTGKELVVHLNGKVREAGTQALTASKIFGGSPRYADAINWFYKKVADLSYWSADAMTPERAAQRLEAAEKVLAMVRERGELWW
jgi:hypothetical protein